MKKILYVIPLFAVLLQGCTSEIDNRTAAEVTKAIADKIIRETTFEYEEIIQKPVLNLQILDYKNQYDSDVSGVYYSMSKLSVESDTALVYGFDYSGAVKIFVNGVEVYEGINKDNAQLKEIAYNMFDWREKVSINLVKGSNTVLVKMVPLNEKPVFFMREIAETAETPLTGTFGIDEFENNEAEAAWMAVGPFNAEPSTKLSIEKKYPPELAGEPELTLELKKEYSYKDRTYSWALPKTNILKQLIIRESNSYKRESYIEWHYANGTTLMGMLSAAEVLSDNKYSDYVSKVCSMNVANKEMLLKQFEDHYAIRGTNNRMFRKTMLDDTGAPALPYLQLYLNSKNENLKPLVDEMADYVMNDQVRLDDGTFCRPEPVEMTIWADDLFMSVPFLVRMGKLTGDTKYYDDAANQIINFNKYLYDEEAGIYKHGWFSPTNEKSQIYWGRANGWIVWATSEALLYLPKDHKSYAVIQNIFKTHIEGLLKYQDQSGMWHQVLNKPESFKETSCTAMYILGIVRGVMNGWVNESYKENAIRAWDELKTKINDDGTVKDICRGTGIGYDDDFYFNRKRFDNDPRGLGAVLTAAVEIMKISERK